MQEDQVEDVPPVVGIPAPLPAAQNNNLNSGRKNDNVTAPRRLSSLLMTVLDTDQRYLTPNEFRQVFTKFLKLNKEIKVANIIIDSLQMFLFRYSY